MSSSIQRGGYWWNQAPDGTWLRWSRQDQVWEVHEGPPPAPGAPPPPPPPAPASAPAEVSDLSGTQVAGSPSPVQATQSEEAKAEAQVASHAEPAAQSEEAQSEEAQSEEDETGTSSKAPEARKANAPIFSAGRRSVAPVLENKKVMGAVGAVVIVMVFLATYMGANVVFRNLYGPQVAFADESANQTMSAAKQRFIERFDRLCARDADKISRLEEQILSVDSPAAMERVADLMSEKFKKQMAKMESFRKPKQDRRLLERILSLQRQVLPFLDRMVAAVRAGDETAVEMLAAEAYANAAKSQRLMQEYGFEVCGSV